MKVLVLSFFPAFTPPRSGGELRLYHVYRELASTAQVVLLSSSHHGVPEERILHTTGFTERRIPKCDQFHAEWQRLEPLASGGDMSAVSVASAGQFATPLHLAYLEEYRDADVVIHDSPFTAPYDLFLGLDSKPRVYNSYNCETLLFRQLHPLPRSQPLQDIVMRCEKRLLQHADLVTYCADADLQAFEQLLGAPLKASLSLPNGLVPPAPQQRKVSSAGRPRALFVGSAHLPNAEAARFIVDALAPAMPEVDFDIAGNCLPVASYPPNVFRYGAVDASTKQSLLDNASVALNPMFTGSGSNLKVLEFFGAGLPVVSTAFGVRGYEVVEGRDFILAEDSTFSKSLRDALCDPKALERIGAQGKATIEAKYSWAAIVCNFSGALAGLMSQTRPSALLDKSFMLGMNDYDPFAGSGGGAVRIQGLIQAVDRRLPVVYLCFGDDDRLLLDPIGTQSIVIKIPRTQAHAAEIARTSKLFWISVADVVTIEHAPRNPTLRALYAALRTRATSVVIDHIYMIGLPREFGDAFVYSSQNNESLLKRDALTYHPERDLHLTATEHAESIAVQTSTLVVAVSEEDAQSFTLGRSEAAPIVVVRNGAHPPASIFEADADIVNRRVGPRSVVFIGSAHMPNVQSCRFIVEELAPSLPDVFFHLIGSAAVSAPKPKTDNVVIWGAVSDSMRSAIMSRCELAVNPMFSGSGSNIKLADFLGHGLHVVTTPFGRRGYPASIDPHVTVTEPEQMVHALRRALDGGKMSAARLREERKALFTRDLAMASMADQFAALIEDLAKPKKRVLFVTYRWIWPVRGGGEAHLLQNVRALVRSGQFAVDVIAPEASDIDDIDRFSSTSRWTENLGAPTGLPHVRYRRFPVIPLSTGEHKAHVRSAWEQQPAFEREVYRSMAQPPSQARLAWGWSQPEGPPDMPGRWSYSSAGIHLPAQAKLSISGNCPQAASLRLTDDMGRQLAHVEISGHFSLSVVACSGEVLLEISGSCRFGDDPRPLGIYVSRITVDERELDITLASLAQMPDSDAKRGIERLHLASVATRSRAHVRLTPGRGPHAPDLDQFLQKEVQNYDMVITHNTVFWTAQRAVTHARSAGVPLVVLPHAHLDDDYYHFPDVTQMALDADLLMVAPKVACDFYRRKGAKRVTYMTAGFDSDDIPTEADETAFRSRWSDDRPFALVLGRKAAPKNYRSIIAAVESFQGRHDLQVVLIGPDDDRLPVLSPVAHYLGPQPRAVVRGALRACHVLINMSQSESFGIVLLEAWQAGKPVIANRQCAAFADLAEHGVNALLSDEENLAACIEALILQPDVAARLGEAGNETVARFEQESVDKRFVSACVELLSDTRLEKRPLAAATFLSRK